MKHRLNGIFHAFTAIALLVTTTTLLFFPVFFLGLLKLIPMKKWQIFCTKQVDNIATLWCSINNFYLKKMPVKWNIEGLDNLDKNNSYMVVANHQSWLDIVVLQNLFNRKIPVMKYFIKDQLKWLPLLGFTWWAMGCPFMKRYSKDYLKRKPHKKGKDIIATKKAIKSLQSTPTAIMNFIEGTRYTQLKHKHQSSPYKHLLMPKAGGLGFVLSSIGDQLSSLLDVTIVYPKKDSSLWDFLCRRVKLVTIHIRHIPLPEKFITEKLNDCPSTQENFRNWLNERWAEKDQLITLLKNKRLTS